MNKFPRITSTVITCVSVFLFASCSSIINGSKQEISIRATPIEAQIFVDGELAGVGKIETKLKRGKEHLIEAKMDGYRTAKLTTDKSMTGWFWGNLICGGVLGGAIDLITGSAYDIDPEHISLTLERGTGSIEKHINGNFGDLQILSPTGENLATLNISWE